MKVFYSKWHVLLAIVHAQHHFFPPSSTLLSELKPSKLKETENPGKMFYMAFSIYTTMLFLRHGGEQ